MTKSSISYIILIFLIFITAFQFSAYGITGEIYAVLRNIIIVTIVVLFLLNFKKAIKQYRKISLFKVHLFSLIVFAFIIVLLIPFKTEIAITPLRDLALALIILMIGLSIDLKERQYIRLINIYIVLYTLAALSIVFTYSSGFEIQERYLPIPKNQVAPAFGVAFVLSIYFSFKKKGFSKWFFHVFTGLLFASLMVIRGRAVIVAVFLTVLVLIFFFIKSRKYKIFTIVIIATSIPFVGNFIYEALFLNYDTSDIDSISTGRFDTYLYGLDFFKNYPLGGILENPYYRGRTIHNYLLFNLVNYGIFIASILFFVFYKYAIKIYQGIRRNSFSVHEAGPLVMVIIFIVSMFEYTYPYAPGSAVFFPFLLMGQYLKLNSQQTQHNA